MSRMLYLAMAYLLALIAGCAQSTAGPNRASSRVDDLADRIRRLESAQASQACLPIADPNASDRDALAAKWSSIDSTRFRDGASLEAIETWMNVILYNIANANTAGFKRAEVQFEDGDRDVALRLTGTRRDMSAGPAIPTNRRLDVMIDGEGFFQVKTKYNGQEVIVYTRGGSLLRNANGNLVVANSEGSILDPVISIPTTVAPDSITIAKNGMVSVRQQGSTELTSVGQILLARFNNPEGLLSIGKNLFVETDVSGFPITGVPGEDGLGQLLSGSLEGSNVSLDRERVDLVFAQRALDINSHYAQGLAYKSALSSSANSRP